MYRHYRMLKVCNNGLFIRQALGCAVYYPIFNRQSFSDIRPIQYVGCHLPEYTVLNLKGPQLTLSKLWKNFKFHTSNRCS